MWDLPGTGLEPVSPALSGRFLITAPPGKSFYLFIYSAIIYWEHAACLTYLPKVQIYSRCLLLPLIYRWGNRLREILWLAHGRTASGDNIGIGTVVYQIPKSVLRGREKERKERGRKKGRWEKRNRNFKINKHVIQVINLGDRKLDLHWCREGCLASTD